MPDTQTQSTTHGAQSGYGGGVTQEALPEASEHERTALDAIHQIEMLDQQQESLRERRDSAVAAMHTADGLRAPEIARRTGMSVTNVRLAIERHTR